MSGSSEHRPNVLLIVMDSVRASNTSLHGYEINTTPFLKKLATQSTVYDQARAPSIWSLPSHVSIFTGVPAHIHGVITGDQTLQQGHSIWEYLEAEHDYSTGLFTSNVYLTEAPVGLQDLFETVKGREEVVRYPDALTPTKATGSVTPLEYLKTCFNHDQPIKSIINGLEKKGKSTVFKKLLKQFDQPDRCTAHSGNFKDWVDLQTGPWAACVNFMDAHAPYHPDNEFDDWGGTSLKSIQNSINNSWDFPAEKEPWWKCKALEAFYDGSIRQMDSEIETIINHLKDKEEYKNTHIVITSDHGEGFGEFCNTRQNVRYVSHGYGIGESLLHVPLLSKRPRQMTSERYDSLASLTMFYDVIKNTVAQVNTNLEVTFEKNPIVVSSHERAKQLNKYLGDDSIYHGDSHALYQENDGIIQKFTRWGPDESIIKLTKTTSSVLSVEEVQHGKVDQILESSDRNQLNETGIKSDDLDESIKQRLEDLGYQ